MRFSLLAILLLFGTASAADWKPAPTPLMTKWGKQITPDKTPWAEYPRPQMVRKDWANLNGLWDYAITNKGDAKPEKWDGKILVPFCIESALSGVGQHPTEKQELWYRRDIDASNWKGKRVLLHFGAVDWETSIWVNGKPVGVYTSSSERFTTVDGAPKFDDREFLTHRGGFDPFSFDITDALKDGKGELVLKVWDPTDKGSQPLGKQISNPHGIWYTPVSGIWQTVWIEPVNHGGWIQAVHVTTDTEKNEITVDTTMGRAFGNQFASVDVFDGETQIASKKIGPFSVPIPIANPKLWTPDKPHLYRIRVRAIGMLLNDGSDEIESYFAMRKVSTGPDENGHLRLLLNDKPLFHIGPLDQGWWPDGLLTPPSEEAMRYDLEVLKKMGMNMVRKHIKIEPSRYYYDCDRMGLLVWQDMPSAINRTKKHFIAPGAKTDADDQFTDPEKKQFRHELKAMIDHLKFFPSIYCWVPFNEGWGQHDTNAILKWTKEYDPTRLVNGPSGWEDRGYGDMKDMHDYPGPNMFPVMKDRVSVLGEFGGLGLPVAGHLWKDQGNWGYRSFKTTDELRTNYHGLIHRLHPLIGKGLSAAVYTQTTDVEIEVNGFMTYDREIMKFDIAETAKWHKSLFGPPPVMADLLPTSEKDARNWRSTTAMPTKGWELSEFNDESWKLGKGGFGTKGTPGAFIGTEWNTKDIWIRQSFELKEVPKGELYLRIHHDEDAEVFINGVLAGKVASHVSNYYEVPMTAAAMKACVKGKNTIAVHCKQTLGGQYIDVGIVEVVAK